MRRSPLSFPLLSVSCFLVTSSAVGQAPSTDIFLLPMGDDGRAGAPDRVIRVTDRDGYDNQPQFLPDGSAIAYSSLGENGTDIYGWNLTTQETELIVSTAQSEYSPTPVPGSDAISVVRDYGDQVQQLWSFPLGSGEPKLLLPDIGPIGYHAWIDAKRVILFVLGEPMTLQTASIGPGKGTVVADNPGRALARIPGEHRMSFVHKLGEDDWWVTAFDPDSGEMERLVKTRPGREDYAWSPDGTLWMGDGSRLFRWTPGTADWSLEADLASAGITDISRLAFDPAGRHLALVSTRPSDETALLELDRRLLEAYVLDRDTGPLEAVGLEEMVVMTPRGAETKSEAVAGVNFLAIDEMRFLDHAVTISDDTAIATALIRWTGRLGDAPAPPRIAFMTVFVRRDGAWRQLGRAVIPGGPPPAAAQD